MSPDQPNHSQSASPEEAAIPTRVGYVAVVGRPNAGKSTLMNAMVGEKLSIVTSKAQTTWQRVTGILSDEDSQMVFLDTPGLLEVRDRMQASMLQAAHQALEEADVVLLVIDAERFKTERDGAVLEEALKLSRAPVIAGINKVDLVSPERVDALSRWAREELHATPLAVSALTGDGVIVLREALKERLPIGPFLYPPDEIASEPVRFFVAEMIRETVFEQFRQEIPYSVACEIGEFRESEDPVYIQATLFADRQPQKRILIGEKGRAIRTLGQTARGKIEAFLERPVYLDLWVKVLPGWRRQPRHLRRLGFRVVEDKEGSGRKGP
jgi:GTP-binding protein Era